MRPTSSSAATAPTPACDELDVDEPRVYLAAGQTWNVEYYFLDYDGKVTVVIETGLRTNAFPSAF